MTNQPDDTLTTVQAAKMLGVRPDSVHAMKSEGRLTVVGKGPNGTNLFAVGEVQAVKTQREQGRRAIPGQAQLPQGDEPGCAECSMWRTRALAAEAREHLANVALQAVLKA